MIDLLPDADQQQIIDSVAGFLGREFPLERLRPKAPTRASERDRWSELAEQGWFGLGLPEAAGGAGFTAVEEMLVHREFGRFLATPCLLATTIAAHLASAAGDEALTTALVGGEVTVALAAPIGAVSIGPTVDGEHYLIDSAEPDLLLSWNAGGMALIERGRLANIRHVEAVDGSTLLERAQAKACPARLFVSSEQAPVRRRANLLIAAALVGMAQASRDLAVEYAGVRTQFGKLIGSFQGVAHHCADMELRASAARAQTSFAAVCERDQRPHAAFQVAAAGLVAADAALQNATMAIRVHGAMGFTAECDVHHYLKRAHVLDRVSGGARALQAELMAQPAPDLAMAVAG